MEVRHMLCNYLSEAVGINPSVRREGSAAAGMHQRPTYFELPAM